MTKQQKPDYVRAYEWATGRVATRFGINVHWWLTRTEILPELESPEWLADVIGGLLKDQKHHIQFTVMGNGQIAAIIYDADSDMEEPNVDGTGAGSTPNAALCAAVKAMMEAQR